MKMTREAIPLQMFAPCGMNCMVCYKHCYTKKPCEGCLSGDNGKPEILSSFYCKLLGWELSHPAQNGTAAITSPDGSVMAFQETDTYVPPVWPWKAGTQGQMFYRLRCEVQKVCWQSIFGEKVNEEA